MGLIFEAKVGWYCCDSKDDQGQVVAPMSKKLQVPLGALDIEVKSVEAAAIFARDIGIQEVIFESDNVISSTEASPAIANVISGTLQHMQFSAKLKFVTREEKGIRKHMDSPSIPNL